MNESFDCSSFIREITIGDAKSFKNLTVFPITSSDAGERNYISLDGALKNKDIEITEVSEGGNVNKLMVRNKGTVAVFMMDGEELVGAKQNRILNTSILIDAASEIYIPVSCVEEGRWSYHTRNFHTSDSVFFSSGRRDKNRYVAKYSRQYGEFRADQGKVWESVAHLNDRADAESHTGAMRDAFERKKADLDLFIENIPCTDGQNGMIVFINDQLMGCDAIGKRKVFRDYYPKLLRSYAIDALLSAKSGKQALSTEEQIKQLWNRIACVEATSCKSVGLGMDWRIEEDFIVGSALVVDDNPIHISLFPVN